MKKIFFFLLLLVNCTSLPPELKTKPAEVIVLPIDKLSALESPKSKIKSVSEIAKKSKCAQYRWKDRGKAPLGYLEGMALVYAKTICHQDREDVKIVSAARKLPESQYDAKDALSWYNSNFKKLGLNNDVSGINTLRNAYTLLIGLGMRESSGKHCCGRDMSANFSTADSAEAGIFQASWGARRASPILASMFAEYKSNTQKCFLEVFSNNVKCSSENAKNWGHGDGYEWQKLTKECPAFSAEYAAVLLRTLGGTKGEFGPLRRKDAEINMDCHAFLKDVEKVIKEQPELCSVL